MRWLLACLIACPAFAEDAPFASFDKASEPVLNDPHDLAFGPDGRLYVADKFGARIAVFDPETLELVDELAIGMLPGVHDIAFGPSGEAVIAVTGAGAVAIWNDPATIGSDPDVVLSAPGTEGAVMHPNGKVYASGAGALLVYDGPSSLVLPTAIPARMT